MKHLLIIICLLAGVNSQAQDTLKLEDLTSKNKLELTEIYLERVVFLVDKIAITAVNESDIPCNSYVIKQFKDINKSSQNNIKVILDKYKSIIPYADKDQLIDSIMFLQEIKLQMISFN